MPATDNDPLVREYAAILDQARAGIRAGREPNWAVVEERLRAVRRAPRPATSPEAVDAAERQALQQLKRVIAVQRARARVAPAQPAPSPRPLGRPRALRTKPTLTGNMEVTRSTQGDEFLLEWQGSPAIVEWEVRISERADARGDYEVRSELTLPAAETRLPLSLGELPQKVHVLGRSKDGRLVRRAVIAALTRDGWNERWLRRASAS